MFLVIRERFCVLFGDTISRDFCKSLEITVGIYEKNRSLEILWGVILSVFFRFLRSLEIYFDL